MCYYSIYCVILTYFSRLKITHFACYFDTLVFRVQDVAKPTWAHPNVRDVAKPAWAHPNVLDVAKPACIWAPTLAAKPPEECKTESAGRIVKKYLHPAAGRIDTGYKKSDWMSFYCNLWIHALRKYTLPVPA